MPINLFPELKKMISDHDMQIVLKIVAYFKPFNKKKIIRKQTITQGCNLNANFM